MTLARSAKVPLQPTGGQSGGTGGIFSGAAPRVLRATAYMVGDSVKDNADLMHKWMDPGGGLLGKLAGAAMGALTGGRINLTANPADPAVHLGPVSHGMRAHQPQRRVSALRLVREADPVAGDLSAPGETQPSRAAPDQPDVGRPAGPPGPHRDAGREPSAHRGADLRDLRRLAGHRRRQRDRGPLPPAPRPDDLPAERQPS